MRIISGKYKGRQINPPAGFRARPTTDFARESLFNILSGRYSFDELAVLDLFSGTGSIGIEFASRGAGRVHMVESNYRHFSFIKKTLEQFDLPGTEVYHTNVRTYLRSTPSAYDLVFADPPYDLEWLGDIPDMVIPGAVKPGGILILEHPRRLSFSDHPSFFEHRSYGNVNFSFFRNEAQ